MHMITPLDLSSEKKLIITNIHNKVVDYIVNKKDINYHFLGGRTGEIPYLYLVEKLIDSDSFDIEQLINADISNIITTLSTKELALGMSTGVSGIGWTLEFLNQQQAQDYDVEFCAAIDNMLLSRITFPKWQGELEHVLGLAGVAAYAARRLEQSDDYRLYEQIVKHYETLAITVATNQVSWPQPVNSVFRLNTEAAEKKEFNLGLAHGVPGIIAALIPALAIPQLKARVETLITYSCNWLIEQRINTAEHELTFPAVAGGSSASRLGWCYGDLTIALTLARAGQALNISKFTDIARETALFSSKKNAEAGQIFEAGICHGSSGLITIFQLLNEILDEPQLEQAALKWLDFTLQLYKDNDLKGFTGFTAEPDEYEHNTGFLTGYAGIGLALITATTGNADWADSLLLK